MNLKIDHFIPFIVIGVLAFLFIFNNKTPHITNDGNYIIQPKHITDIFRVESKSNDHSVTITHNDSKDKLKLLIVDNQLALPDGEKTLPVKIGIDGKEHPIFDVKPVERDIIFDVGWDFGCYAGFVSNVPKDQNRIKDFDVGIRFSPLRIYNTFATDILISSQDVGFGISFYPMPLKYGDIFQHLGIGIGRVIDYDVKDQHNIFYVSFSTKF